MVIGDWLGRLDYQLLKGSLSAPVSEVVYDSRKAGPETVFVCLKGRARDSHEFIPQAYAAGCRVFVVEREVSLPEDASVILVKNGREALAELSAARFGYPAEKLMTIGITGTKGKTTTSYMIRRILEAMGKKTGLIGTNGVLIGTERIPTANTTPESYLVQEYFAEMVKAGCGACVMEVSSQALMLSRVGGIRFDIGLFTNIFPDHVGPNEHKSFEEYLYYKSRLLTVCKTGVINRKTEHYDEIVRDSTCRLVTYELADSGAGTGSGPCALADGGAGTGLEPCAPADGSPADFTGGNLHYASDHEFVGIEFDIRGGLNGRVRVGMPGKFNADNALAALAVCRLALSKERKASGDPAGFDQAMMNALADVRVDGRMELVHVSSKYSVIVDYAHNAVSMESLLKTLRAYHPKRLVCVFGCGGNRAKERRYSMGEIGGRLADFCILTADNPRFEKNEDIIKDIESGMAKTSGKYMVIPDRKEAILYAVRHAEEGDMIAVIGKGHEDYQEIEGVRHHFLDREIVEEAVRETE